MESIPFFEPGKRVTVHANVALTGGRFCALVGNIQSGPGLSATAEGGNYLAGLPAAAGRVFGVVQVDCPAGGKVAVMRGSGFICDVEAAAAIAAFQEVEVNALGQVVPLAAGVAVGFACTAIANGASGPIALHR